MNDVLMYGLKNCDTCKKAINWLLRKNIAHQFIDYREHRIAPEVLKAWAKQIGWEKLVNKVGTTWKGLAENRKKPGSDAEWSLLIREHPALVKRPVLVIGDPNHPVQISVGFNDKLFMGVFESALKSI